jgi:hypothetical protein
MVVDGVLWCRFCRRPRELFERLEAYRCEGGGKPTSARREEMDMSGEEIDRYLSGIEEPKRATLEQLRVAEADYHQLGSDNGHRREELDIHGTSSSVKPDHQARPASSWSRWRTPTGVPPGRGRHSCAPPTVGPSVR